MRRGGHWADDRGGAEPALLRPAAPRRESLVQLRLMLVALCLCLWGLVMLGRLVQLQVVERGFYERQAARQSERTITLDPRRGPILDRRGRPLAVSVDAESIYAVPQDVADPVPTAAALARALDLDAAARKELLAQLRKSTSFAWVRRRVDPATAAGVRALQLEGIGFLTETRRYYPKRELAAQVLGYVGLDEGLGGIEHSFEALIRGRGAKVVVRTDARRRPFGHIEKPSTQGHAVVLTLDETIQHVAEKELDRAVAETQSIAGVAVVLDPWTGEILAMANRPTFNPNRYQASSPARWRNRAVADAYEPGSIFKVFTAAAGLQRRVVGPDDVIDCGHGSVEVAGTRINDHAVFDQLTFRQVIAKSSDVGVIRVAQRVGRDEFASTLRDLGFGTPTGVDLPGESSGLLRPTARWSALSLASISFGQEVGVTALQVATAAAAVANGGYLMKPLAVSRVEDASGALVKAYKPVVVRRVLEPSTAEVLTDLMQSVVKEGTGRRAAIPGYAVAGKTGTAQKVDANGRYSMVDHVASFVGFVPASRPALVVLVSLDTPKGPRNQGGDVAAPLFARIAEQALRYLAVPPDDMDRVLRAAVPAGPQAQPAAYLSPAPLPADEGDERLMPDLRGRPAREAALAAARRGLAVELRGSGRVYAQLPEPGTEIEAGATCVLALSREAPAAPSPLPPPPGPAGLVPALPAALAPTVLTAEGPAPPAGAATRPPAPPLPAPRVERDVAPAAAAPAQPRQAPPTPAPTRVAAATPATPPPAAPARPVPPPPVTIPAAAPTPGPQVATAPVVTPVSMSLVAPAERGPEPGTQAADDAAAYAAHLAAVRAGRRPSAVSLAPLGVRGTRPSPAPSPAVPAPGDASPRTGGAR